jgi:hypothetical protein
MDKSNREHELRLFKETGFFEETELAIQHLRDADEILFSEGVDYCIMFGTLLGMIRHDGLIPWDDDLDIIVFDADKFESRCRQRFEEKGYVVYSDMRTLDGTERRFGYRLHSEQGVPIPGQSWKFPWLGIWEADTHNEIMTLPPEDFRYSIGEFLPLEIRSFLDFTVSVPRLPVKIVKDYYGEDCLEICMLHGMNHRQYKPTGYPETKFPLGEVMAFLKEHS